MSLTRVPGWLGFGGLYLDGAVNIPALGATPTPVPTGSPPWLAMGAGINVTETPAAASLTAVFGGWYWIAYHMTMGSDPLDFTTVEVVSSIAGPLGPISYSGTGAGPPLLENKAVSAGFFRQAQAGEVFTLQVFNTGAGPTSSWSADYAQFMISRIWNP